MMRAATTWISIAALGVALGAGAVAACDNSSGVHETPPGADAGPSNDAGVLDGANPDGAPTDDCFPNPKTHDEIINACTDASKFDKNPKLPLLLADGGLPPLP